MNVRLNANTNGWGAADFELTPGKIDMRAAWVFTRGQCHSLALAIHEETGWDVVGVYAWVWDNDPDDDEDSDPMPGHVAIRTPDGGYLDITGRYESLDAYRDFWERDLRGNEVWVRDIDPQDAYDAFGHLYREPEVDAARHWVEPLLALTAPVFPSVHFPEDAIVDEEEDW